MDPHKVEISLKRVQSFLFEVPRLKAMLGANALLGETMRHQLAALAKSEEHTNHLHKMGWPVGVKIDSVDDPLAHPSVKADDKDDPVAQYGSGILARDGGHFIVVFQDRGSAEKFKTAAEAMLAEKLPGVQYDARVSPFGKDSPFEQQRSPLELHSLDLPVLQVCQETGSGVASTSKSTKNDSWVAKSVHDRLEAGERFYSGKTHDIIGLLARAGVLYPNAMGWGKPDDLKDLAAGGYIALIHSDGNGIGKRYNAHKSNGAGKDIVHTEALGEAFYHSMRVTVRKALVAALQKTFDKPDGTRPYEILMLGGDDLLLVCRADKALHFAVSYAEKLKGKHLSDGKDLDVAIGVAIAKPTYPVHRLHELAESLASSAKRQYRAMKDQEGSMIDWQVVTQSWFSDLEAMRQDCERVRYSNGSETETLLLTGRPYRHETVRKLMNSVEALDALKQEEKAARSSLRSLRGACEEGRLAGEMAFLKLHEEEREALGGSLWQELEEGTYLTRALDIIGIDEIARLGRKRND